MKTPSIVGSVVLIGSLALAASSYADARSITLVSEVEVRNDSVYLSDLMSGSSAAAVREAAEKTFISVAPQPGETRILSGVTVRSILRRESVLAGVVVPSEIVIHRSGRLITREEVAAAINDALGHAGIPGGEEIRPGDITFSAPVMTSAASPDLEVLRFDMDPAIQEAKFVLRSRAERRSPPFVVTAHSANLESAASPREKNVPANTASALSGSIVLVRPGQLARMFLVSGTTMQLQLDVVPLESGRLGQEIRVRIPGKTKILQAEVVGAGQLEARF